MNFNPDDNNLYALMSDGSIATIDTGTGVVSTAFTLSGEFGRLIAIAWGPAPEVQSVALTVTKTGNGTGTVSSMPSGIQCGNACSFSFKKGTSVTLSAVSNSGSTLTGWSGGGCSGTAPCTITMDTDTVVSMGFDLIDIPPTCSGPSYLPRLFGNNDFVFQYTAQAPGGLANILATHSANADVSIPPFTPGTTDRVTITVTKTFGFNSSFSAQVQDIVGHVTSCIPPTTPPTSALLDINLGPPVTLNIAAEDTESGLCEVRARVRQSGGAIVQEVVPITPNQFTETVPVELREGQVIDRLTIFDCAGNFSFFDIRTQVVVDNLVTPEGAVSKSYDPTPVANGPAGVFTITAKFRNTSTKTIVKPFFQVFLLTEGNVLLNADRGPGGLGATFTPQGSATAPFTPGSVGTFVFEIGLRTNDRFTFLVDLMGQAK
jgi:hypothetical protein